MDWLKGKETVAVFMKKYRYVLLVLAVGLFLMALPEQESPPEQTTPIIEQTEPQLQDTLAQLLSHLEGAGKVEVMLTQSKGQQTLYQTDEDTSVSDGNTDTHRKTVLVSGSDRGETGLIRQINPPTYQGAIVLCQGADNANIRLSIVEAVMSVTGLRSDCITVLKMK